MKFITIPKIGVYCFIFFLMPYSCIYAEDKSSFESTLKQLKDKNEDIRRKAAESLGESNDERAVKPLIKVLRDKKLKVRVSAADSLGRLGNKKAVKPLLRLLKKDQEAAPIVIRALGRLMDKQALKPLKEILVKKDPILVVEAALALSYFEEEDIYEAYMEALDSTDDYGCQAIVNILGRKKLQRAVSPLIQVARVAGSRPSCQLSAVEALGWIGDPQSIPTLEGILASSATDEVKVRVIIALGRLKATEMYLVIVQFLNHQQPMFKKAAVESLVYLGDRRAIPYLKKMADDPNPTVKSVVQYALNQFGVN